MRLKKFFAIAANFVVVPSLTGLIDTAAAQVSTPPTFTAPAVSPSSVDVQLATQAPPPSSVTQISPSVQPRAGAVINRRSRGNVMVNENPATLLLPQTEPSIASNPANFRQLVTGFADQSNGDFAPGVSISGNGGASWTAAPGGAILPDPPGFIWGVRTVATSLAGGDAAVA